MPEETEHFGACKQSGRPLSCISKPGSFEAMVEGTRNYPRRLFDATKAVCDSQSNGSAYAGRRTFSTRSALGAPKDPG